jgi:hypothetical protein
MIHELSHDQPNLTNGSGYQSVTIEINLRLKPQLTEEEIAEIVLSASRDVREAIRERCLQDL